MYRLTQRSTRQCFHRQWPPFLLLCCQYAASVSAFNTRVLNFSCQTTCTLQMTVGCAAVICEPVFATVNMDGQLMSRRAHTDKLDLCGCFGRPMNADPTVSAVAWSRAFRQNPPLKDPYTHPVLSCPPPLHPL